MHSRKGVQRRKCSPVKIGRAFILNATHPDMFVDLGFQSGNDSIQHTLYQTRHLLRNDVMLSDAITINGLCSYHYIYMLDVKVVVGILFVTPRSRSAVSDHKLVVSNHEFLPDVFTPVMDLEKLGILMFSTQEGSLLVISSGGDSRLLVRAD